MTYAPVSLIIHTPYIYRVYSHKEVAMCPSTSAAKQGESITVKVTPPGSVMTIPGPAEVQVIVTSSAPTPHAGSNPGTPVFP